MPARLLAEWRAFFQLEPFGPPAEFWRAGLLAAMMRNVNRAKSTDKISSPEDFMPRSMVDEDHEADSEEAAATQAALMLERFKAYNELQTRYGQ